jgi:hypothetical protein
MMPQPRSSGGCVALPTIRLLEDWIDLLFVFEQPGSRARIMRLMRPEHVEVALLLEGKGRHASVRRHTHPMLTGMGGDNLSFTRP